MKASIFSSGPLTSLLADIDDLAFEHVDQRENLGPLLGRRGNGDKHQVACDYRLADKILHFNDGDNPGQLLSDLFNDTVIADNNNRHPAQVGVLGSAGAANIPAT
jgi:hypothetical protein